MVSGKEIEAQITRIETTVLGTYLNVEFDDEVASITAKQIIGFYDFCFFKGRRGKQHTRKRAQT
jgi:exonuclease I